MSRLGDPLNTAFSAETIKRRSVMGAAATFAAQAVKFGAQLAARVILARFLDPRDFGLIAMVAPVLGFVQVLNTMGFAQAVVQRAEITQRQVSALFWINASIGLCLSVLTMAFAPVAAWLYGEPRIAAITAVLGSLIFMTSLSVLPSALLNRQLRFIPLAIVDGGCILVGVLVGIWAAWSGMGYWSLVMMQVGTSVSGLLLLWLFLPWRPDRPRRQNNIGSLVKFGANLTGSNMATYVSMSADTVLVGVLAGPVALGLYDTSYNLVVKPLSQVTAPITRVAVPMLSRLVSVPQRYATTYISMIQVMLLTYLPGMIFVILFAKPLLLIALGGKWASAIPVFAWVSLGGIAAPLFSSAGWLLTSQDRTRELMLVSIATAVLSVASFAFGAIWGVVGVAMSSALCFTFLQFPLIIWVALRSGPVSIGLFVRALFPFLVAACVCACVLTLLGTKLPDGLGSLIVLAGVSYLAFYAVAACLPGGLTMFRRLSNLRTILRGGGGREGKDAIQSPLA